MIYEREKLELFGINWLNYSDLFFIIGLILIAYAFYRHRKSRVIGIRGVCEDVACALGIIALWLSLGFTFGVDGGHSVKDAPLSAIDNKISVSGEKVAIDKLDENFRYQDDYLDSSKRNLFKFEYDDIFESGKLINDVGHEYKLSKEDTSYLRSKQAKGEK